MIIKSADEIIKCMPGAYIRRKEIIIALCQTGPWPNDAGATAKWIVETANAIIERTEQ